MAALADRISTTLTDVTAAHGAEDDAEPTIDHALIRGFSPPDPFRRGLASV